MKKLLFISLITIFISCTKEEYTVTCTSKANHSTIVQTFDNYKAAKGFKLLTENDKMYLMDTLAIVEIPNDCHCDIK